MNGHTLHQMIIHETMPKWKCIKARVCHGYYYYLLEVMLHFRVLHMIIYAIWCITSISITAQWDVLIWFKISPIIMGIFEVYRNEFEIEKVDIHHNFVYDTINIQLILFNVCFWYFLVYQISILCVPNLFYFSTTMHVPEA